MALVRRISGWISSMGRPLTFDAFALAARVAEGDDENHAHGLVPRQLRKLLVRPKAPRAEPLQIALLLGRRGHLHPIGVAGHDPQ